MHLDLNKNNTLLFQFPLILDARILTIKLYSSLYNGTTQIRQFMRADMKTEYTEHCVYIIQHARYIAIE